MRIYYLSEENIIKNIKEIFPDAQFVRLDVAGGGGLKDRLRKMGYKLNRREKILLRRGEYFLSFDGSVYEAIEKDFVIPVDICLSTGIAKTALIPRGWDRGRVVYKERKVLPQSLLGGTFRVVEITHDFKAQDLYVGGDYWDEDYPHPCIVLGNQKRVRKYLGGDKKIVPVELIDRDRWGREVIQLDKVRLDMKDGGVVLSESQDNVDQDYVVLVLRYSREFAEYRSKDGGPVPGYILEQGSVQDQRYWYHETLLLVRSGEWIMTGDGKMLRLDSNGNVATRDEAEVSLFDFDGIPVDGDAMKLFTVREEMVGEGIEVSGYTCLDGQVYPVVRVGERSNRQYMLTEFIPVVLRDESKKFFDDNGYVVIKNGVITKNRNGHTVIVESDSMPKADRIGVLFKTPIGFRGDNEHFGLDDQGTKVDFPGTILVRGRITQGKAGRMGSGDQFFALMQAGMRVGVHIGGRRYGKPHQYRYQVKDGGIDVDIVG